MIDISLIRNPGDLWTLVQKHVHDEALLVKLTRFMSELQEDMLDYIDHCDHNGIEPDLVLEHRYASCDCLNGVKYDDGLSFVFVFGSERVGLFLATEDDRITNFVPVDHDTTEVGVNPSELN